MVQRTKCSGRYQVGGPSETATDSLASAATVFRSGGVWSNGFWGRGQGDRVCEGPFSKLFYFKIHKTHICSKEGANGVSVSKTTGTRTNSKK
jgi:hypothetical protein